MPRDFLSLVRRPKDLLKSLRKIALGGVIAATGVSASPSIATAAGSPPSEPNPTIVDRSRKVAKLILQLPGTATAYLRADHRSHRSHSSHRSHFSSSGGGAPAPAPAPVRPPAPEPARPAAPAPTRPVPLISSNSELAGKEFRPTGDVDLYEALGVANFRRVTADQIKKEALMFVIQDVSTFNRKTFYKVAIRSWAFGGGDRMFGWVEAQPSASAPESPVTRLPTTTTTPGSTAILDLTTATTLASGEIVSIDTEARTITVRESATARTIFAYRDDSLFEGTLAISVRFDDFGASNGGRLPVAASDRVQITWRTTPDGKTRIVNTIKKAP